MSDEATEKTLARLRAHPGYLERRRKDSAELRGAIFTLIGTNAGTIAAEEYKTEGAADVAVLAFYDTCFAALEDVKLAVYANMKKYIATPKAVGDEKVFN